MSNSLTAVTVVLMVLGMYVLLFSTISLLYKVVVIVYIFVLLFLFTLALQDSEMMQKSGARMRSQEAHSGRGTGVELACRTCSAWNFVTRVSLFSEPTSRFLSLGKVSASSLMHAFARTTSAR
jgi:hypothetical protein